MKIKAKIVPNGNAKDESLAQIMMLRTNRTISTNPLSKLPDKNDTVLQEALCLWVNVLKVCLEVALDSSQEHDRHGQGHKGCNNHRVDQSKPVHFAVMGCSSRSSEHLPSIFVIDVHLLTPVDRVCERHHHLVLSIWINGKVGVILGCTRAAEIGNRLWINLKSDNSLLVSLSALFVPSNNQHNMIMKVANSVLDKTKGKSSNIVLFGLFFSLGRFAKSCGTWEAIDDPLDHVLVLDEFVCALQPVGSDHSITKSHTGFILLKFEMRRGLKTNTNKSWKFHLYTMREGKKKITIGLFCYTSAPNSLSIHMLSQGDQILDQLRQYDARKYLLRTQSDLVEETIDSDLASSLGRSKIDDSQEIARRHRYTALKIKDDRPRYVPPINFAIVEAELYRSGHPQPNNFEFLDTLNLKTIIYLGDKTDNYDYYKWIADHSGERTISFRFFKMKPPSTFGTSHLFNDEVALNTVLNLVANKENYPILIHSNKGKHRVGVLVGLIRKFLQGWNLSGTFDEYAKFAREKGEGDLEFIEMFKPIVKIDADRKPDFIRTG
ncbi:hypothetical protein OGAPHI_007305 [Ogataea philodendri]|uniref:Putative tyrosine-protein phosphatase OCA1 n=1 Tax=Ogataea philodendri TaxID=1378263 RepID=A0A9P8NV42_9ASCO|nr:uncharacterized protein OGAPHI_007305 [Ogataea philodendri]KAH3660100.1 hypothetical protein OGAPHI_007305 [Ogataea philodendri]